MNRQWLLARRPDGPLEPEHFRWAETEIPVPAEGEILVRNRVVSCDPTQRSWMAGRTYLPAIKIGEVIRSLAVGEVVESKHPGFAAGDVVHGLFGWQDYCATSPISELPARKLPPGISPDDALGIFGLTGLTAYFGLFQVGEPRAGETVVVSGAAGATGSIVGQLAKIAGCRAVGIAGGREKCDYLLSIGYDAAIDYKSENLMTRLRETCPDGVHVFFDNVGGRTLDTVLLQLALKARVVICGAIATYDPSVASEGLRNHMQLLVRRSRMEGFLMHDYNDLIDETISKLAGHVRDGKLLHRNDVVTGLENAPAALGRLFRGENRGKQLVHVVEGSAS